MSIAEARMGVPSRPGLYAVHGDHAVWENLGLGEPTDARPLYVGKAERSLASRDVDTHFSTGKTGSSTLRAALPACSLMSWSWRDDRATLPSPRDSPTSGSRRRVTSA